MAALHYAATSDYNLPIIVLLAAYGAKINAPDRFGRTPLDHATERGSERVPSELTSRGGQKGAEVRRRRSTFSSALHTAALQAPSVRPGARKSPTRPHTAEVTGWIHRNPFGFEI